MNRLPMTELLESQTYLQPQTNTQHKTYSYSALHRFSHTLKASELVGGRDFVEITLKSEIISYENKQLPYEKFTISYA